MLCILTAVFKVHLDRWIITRASTCVQETIWETVGLECFHIGGQQEVCKEMNEVDFSIALEQYDGKLGSASHWEDCGVYLAGVVDTRPGVADEARGDSLCGADAGTKVQFPLIGWWHRLEVEVVRKQTDVIARQLQPTLYCAHLQWKVLQCEHRLHTTHTHTHHA